MDTFYQLVFYAMISLPLSAPAALAIFSTSPDRSQGILLRIFRNRYSGVGAGLVVVVLTIALSSLAVYYFSGCRGGLDRNSSCSWISGGAGDFFFTSWYLGYQYLVYFGLPASAVFWAAEIVTRARLLSADSR